MGGGLTRARGREQRPGVWAGLLLLLAAVAGTHAAKVGETPPTSPANRFAVAQGHTQVLVVLPAEASPGLQHDARVVLAALAPHAASLTVRVIAAGTSAVPSFRPADGAWRRSARPRVRAEWE